MLSGWRFSYLAYSVFIACLFCGFSCVDIGAEKIEAGNGWGVSLILPLVPLLGLGRKTVVADMVCSCGGGRGNFCIKRTQGSGTVYKSGNLTPERGGHRS